jgi:hypothetical protein
MECHVEQYTLAVLVKEGKEDRMVLAEWMLRRSRRGRR